MTTITIDMLEAGQQPYADARHRARIKAERSSVCSNCAIPRYLTEAEVKQLARIFIHDFKDKPEWHESRITSLISKDLKIIAGEPKAPEWEVLIITPYTG